MIGWSIVKLKMLLIVYVVIYFKIFHKGGGEAFSSLGFRSWHKKKRLDTHVEGPNSDHNKAKK